MTEESSAKQYTLAEFLSIDKLILYDLNNHRVNAFDYL